MDKEKGVLPTTNLKHPLDLYLTDTCGEDKNTYFLRTENQVWCKRISTSLLKAISLQLKKKKKSHLTYLEMLNTLLNPAREPRALWLAG